MTDIMLSNFTIQSRCMIEVNQCTTFKIPGTLPGILINFDYLYVNMSISEPGIDI